MERKELFKTPPASMGRMKVRALLAQAVSVRAAQRREVKGFKGG